MLDGALAVRVPEGPYVRILHPTHPADKDTDVETRFELLYAAGACGRARDEATRWGGLEPQSPKPFAMLARTLHATGAPRPSLEETLSHRWANIPAADQKRAETWDRAFLAVLDADFTKTEDLAREYDTLMPFDSDSSDHAAPARLRINVLRELDRTKDAAKVAHTFLDRMAAFRAPWFRRPMWISRWPRD